MHMFGPNYAPGFAASVLLCRITAAHQAAPCALATNYHLVHTGRELQLVPHRLAPKKSMRLATLAPHMARHGYSTLTLARLSIVCHHLIAQGVSPKIRIRSIPNVAGPATATLRVPAGKALNADGQVIDIPPWI